MENLQQKLETEIRLINDIFIHRFEPYSHIKAVYTIEKKRWKKLIKDNTSDKIEGKYKKSNLEDRDLKLLYRVNEKVLSRKEKLQEFFESNLCKAEQTSSLIDAKRDQAIEEAKSILKGVKIIKSEMKLSKKQLPDKVINPFKRMQRYPDKYLAKWIDNKSPVDYRIMQMLIHIFSRAKEERKEIEVLNKKFRLNEKKKRKALKGYTWWYECLCLYEDLLILDREFDNQLRSIYQNIYFEIIQEIEASHRCLNWKIKRQ